MHGRIISIVCDLFEKRKMIYALAKRDFQSEYMGSYLGMVWAFLGPFLFITILYVVFTFGMRSTPVEGENFILYLVSGMVAWLFFSEALNNGTCIFDKFSFLIKRVDFRLSILLVVAVISTLPKHMFFIVLAILIALFNGVTPSLYIFQTLYYLLAMMFLLLGICWTTASVNLFAKDVSKLVIVVLQFGFWLTPIFWSINLIPTNYQWLIKINPVWYLVEGYRDSLFRDVGFWEKPLESLYFWLLALVLNILGIAVYRTIKPYFAEVV